MTRRANAPATFLLAASLFVSGLIGGIPGVAAQGEPTEPAQAEPALASEDVPPEHPAHIHAGTCADLGDVVYPLEPVRQLEMDVEAETTRAAEPTESPSGTPGSGENMGEGENHGQSISSVDASLEDLLESEHAINVHESEENIETFIACGDITGEVSDAGALIIDVQEVDGSGFSGEATLTDNRDGTVSVTILLTQPDTAATPEATPSE